MDYPHRITICVPEALAPDANALMLAVGEQPGDDQSFTGEPESAIPADPPIPAYAKGTLATAATVAALTGPDALTAPGHAPDVDLDAAERARDALSLTGPATADAISLRIDMPHDAALENMGLTEEGDP